MNSLGIDLAGSSTRPTGMCLLDESYNARTWLAYSDEEIVEAAFTFRPSIIAIDAPLSLPLGRRSLEERSGPHLRDCDRALKELGIRFLPVTLGPMRALTARGIRLKSLLEGNGFTVIEVYPGGAQDVLGIPRKTVSLALLREGLEKLGIRGLQAGVTADELDAVTAALVGMLYLNGSAVVLGGRDGAIVMPPFKPQFRKARKGQSRASAGKRPSRQGL